MAAARTLVRAVAAGVAQTGQCGGKGGGGGKVCRQQAARYEALAHVKHHLCRRQPPEQGPDTIYQLEMEPGRTGMRRGQVEQSSAALQGSRAGQVEGGTGK